MSEQKEDFWLLYSSFCVRSKVYPLKTILRHLKGTELCCPVESIRPEHWLFLLLALCNDDSLTKVHFASAVSPHGDFSVKSKRNRRDRGFPTPYGRTEQNIRNMCMALGRLMHSSKHLAALKFENLSLNILDAEQLAAGFAKPLTDQDKYLTHLSFSGCQFESGSVPIICNSLRSSKVSWLDLSSCALNPSDVEAVSLLIKAQSLRRGCEMYPESFRYGIADLNKMKGLNRVSLNDNQLEHESVLLLVENLTDDLWMKAIDLQNCGIENEGAEALIKLACKKCELEIIDLRLNYIDEGLLHRLEEQLELNRTGKTLNYSLMPLWGPSEMIRKYNSVRKTKVPKKPSVYKLKIIKKPSRSLDYSSLKSSTVRNRTCVMQDACVQTSLERSKPVPKHLQDLYYELRNKYQYEVKLRKYFMSKFNVLKTENDQLKELLKNQNDEIYIDQETYFDIKHTFEKLKIFFDVMKKYGLWEYISVLGFDEATDVMMLENDSGKQMTLTRKESCCQENKCRLESDEEPCCKCRKMDPKHKHTESCGFPEGAQNYALTAAAVAATTKLKAAHDKYIADSVKDYFLKEKGPYRLLQELVNDYNHAANIQQFQKTMSARQTNAANVPQDNTKATSSKQPRSLSPKPASAAHLLIKKFSYSNMPKKLKELISPSDFYKIVKKELERCEIEARKTLPSAYTESSSQTSSNSASQIHAEKYVPVKHSETNSASTSNKESTPVSNKESTPKYPAAMCSNDEDYDNITISELIAREKAMLALKQNRALKNFATKKEPAKSSVSSVPSSKTQKNSSHARDREAFLKLDQIQAVVVDRLTEHVLPKSKLKYYSSTSQTSSKKIQPKSNTSSEGINSSNSIVTENDKSSASSVASSSKSHAKSSSNHSESDPQKSYIESVSDASTFRDVKSISMSEIASEVLEKDEPNEKNTSSIEPFNVESVSSQSSNKKEDSVAISLAIETKGNESKNKSVSSVKASKDGSTGSQSSTIKELPEIQNGKADQSVACKSPVQSTSKKTDRSIKANSPPQGKTKNGKNSKNRPKSNSKSSSVPSLSDITTVSSQSLNTDSVMKQISGSEEN